MKQPSSSKYDYDNYDEAHQLRKEIEGLNIYKQAIIHMCSVRQENVDDYIMIAKQAVYDYEMGNLNRFKDK